MTDRRAFLGLLAVVPFLGLAAKLREKRWTAKRKVEGGGDGYWYIIKIEYHEDFVRVIHRPDFCGYRGMSFTKEECDNLGAHYIFERV